MQNPGGKMSLVELVEVYYSESIQLDKERKLAIIQQIFIHEEIKSAIKNQSQIIKKIFTHETVALLIQYLISENTAHAEQLKSIKYDPSGELIPISLRLPFMAMEIMSCECQAINELLFQTHSDHPPLLLKLLSFLDSPEHYHLASYFSRVICAVTKRVSSPSHKFNAYFAELVFGKEAKCQQNPSYLQKSVNHLYSLTTIEYITKWLLISSKTPSRQQIDGQIFQKNIVNFRKDYKVSFLISLIQKVGNGGYVPQVLNNIPLLFEQMLSQTEKSNKIVTSLNIKSFPQIPTGQKTTLYDLATNEELIKQVFKSPEEKCLNLAKIRLLKIYLSRYVTQLVLLQKGSEQQAEKQLKILQVIENDHLSEAIDWIFDHLKRLCNINSSNSMAEVSAIVEKEQIQQSRLRLTSPQKMIILHLLEVVRIIHTLETYRLQLVEFYNSNSNEMVRLIKRLMSLENNLIQLETSKLVLSMLKSKQKQKDQMRLPYQFATKLLTNAIPNLIELQSAQCHVIEWADIILSHESKHIFENYEEQFEWEHIRQVVEEVKKIHVGQFRLIQSNIDCFYSEEKALLKYSSFLNDFKVQIIYQQKKQVKEGQSEKKVILAERQLQEESGDIIDIIPVTSENIVGYNIEQIIDESKLDLFQNNYLCYDVSVLLEQI